MVGFILAVDYLAAARVKVGLLHSREQGDPGSWGPVGVAEDEMSVWPEGSADFSEDPCQELLVGAVVSLDPPR